jgi:serine/threonine-protein kinase HipA
MERVLGATRDYLPSESRRRQLEILGWHLLTNFVVRNADCHSKNIALYYTTYNDVAYAPVYDLVTTQAYTGYKDQEPGLSIGGRRTWAPGKSLETFFKARLNISPSEYAAMVQQLCDSAVVVGRELIELSRKEPTWHGIVKNMLHAWNEGMSSLRDPRTPERFMGLTTDIERAGFCDADKPAKSARLDESPLLGRK